MKFFLFLLLAIFSFHTHFADAAGSPVVIKTQAELSATTTSTKVLDPNIDRKYLIIINKGSVNILVKFGAAHIGTEGVIIPAGGNYEPFQVPVDAVWIRSASGTQAMLVIEGI